MPERLSQQLPQQLRVVGLGPAGMLAAHRAAARGWQVVGFDPHGPNVKGTLCCFRSQLPAWFPAGAIASTCTVAVQFGSARKVLDDEYVVLSPELPKFLDGFEVRREAADLQEEQVASGTGLCSSQTEPFTSSGQSLSRGQSLTLDCTPPGVPMAARQFAVGVFVPEEVVPAEHRVAVLMDWTPLPEGDEHSEAIASFSYRIPIGEGTWLIQETVLATEFPREAVMPMLQRRLAKRLESFGVKVGLVETGLVEAGQLEDESALEFVDFPLGPASLLNAPSHFGAQAGWMHPATGYSFGELASDVDRVLDQLSTIALDSQTNPLTSFVFGPRSPGLKTRSQMIAEYLQRLGLVALLSFSPSETRRFFQTFFELKLPVVDKYLTGRKATGTAEVMMKLWAQLLKRDPKLAAKVLWQVSRAMLRAAAGL